MDEEKKISVPTKHLPKDWREKGSAEFGLSKWTIEKVVYGTSKNTKVFDYMLAMALQGKYEAEERLARLQSLAE